MLTYVRLLTIILCWHDPSGDRLLTNSATEKKTLVQGGSYKEVCHSISGPSVFCVDTSIEDGRDGPFMLYNNASVVEQSGALKVRTKIGLTSQYIRPYCYTCVQYW